MGSAKLANNVLKGGMIELFLYGPIILLAIIIGIVLLIIIYYTAAKPTFKWLFSTKPKQYTDTITVKDKRLKGNYVSGYVYLIAGTNRNVYVVSKFDYERININDTFTAAIEDKHEDMLYVRKIMNFTS
jgi:hypothetical protein